MDNEESLFMVLLVSSISQIDTEMNNNRNVTGTLTDEIEKFKNV